jgi:hypothetical protein
VADQRHALEIEASVQRGGGRARERPQVIEHREHEVGAEADQRAELVGRVGVEADRHDAL